MSYKDLKRNRQQNLDKLVEQTKEMKKTGFETDPNDWYPGVDKAGNGLATIRFLPAISDEDLDYVRWWEHSFKDPNTNQWYINLSRSTLYPKSFDSGIDPVMDINKKLWDGVPGHLSKEEAAKHPYRIQAVRQSRKINFRSNIYIVDDSVNPENNGQVKKFKYGKWVFDHIEGLLFPNDLALKKGVKSINPFDLEEAPNFEIVCFTETKGGERYRNYSKSHFTNDLISLGTEKKNEEVYNAIQGWSIKDYVNPDKFKSYEELKKRLDIVLGFDTAEWQPNAKKAIVNKPVESRQISSVKEREVPIDDPKESSDDFFSKLTEDEDIPF